MESEKDLGSSEGMMGKINWTRVLLGGLVAGLIINVFEFITNGVFLADEWEAAMKSTGASAPGSGAMMTLTIWGFLMGIAAVWLYAAARPRFGPGVKTAVMTGFAFWLLSSALSALDEAATGIYPVRLVTILALVCLVQNIVASVAGAWIYKESPIAS